MSSFDTISFKVVPDGSFYPSPGVGDDGMVTYGATLQFDTRSHKNSFMNKTTLVTWHRPLGTRGYNGHIEAGFGMGTLTVPASGGVSVSYDAVLVACEDIKGYGREIRPTFQVNARFVIVGDGAE